MRQRRTMDEVREVAADRAYTRLVSKLERVVITLETMGEEDMGLLNHDLAQEFHRGTERLRALLVRLGGGR